jgi:hypothetical protein
MGKIARALDWLQGLQALLFFLLDIPGAIGVWAKMTGRYGGPSIVALMLVAAAAVAALWLVCGRLADRREETALRKGQRGGAILADYLVVDHRANQEQVARQRDEIGALRTENTEWQQWGDLVEKERKFHKDRSEELGGREKLLRGALYEIRNALDGWGLQQVITRALGGTPEPTESEQLETRVDKAHAIISAALNGELLLAKDAKPERRFGGPVNPRRLGTGAAPNPLADEIQRLAEAADLFEKRELSLPPQPPTEEPPSK